MKQYNLEDAFPKSTEQFHQAMVQTLEGLPEKKGNVIHMEKKMKRNRWSGYRVAAASLVAVMVLGTSAFAVSKVMGYVSSTSTKAYYTEAPSSEQVGKDFGFKPKLVQKFSNGYEFDKGYKETRDTIGESDKTIGKNTMLTFDYQKGDSNVSMDVVDGNYSDDTAKTAMDAKEYQNVSLYYSSELYRFVPEDYEKTAQDIEDEKAGKVTFSYADKASEEQISSVVWVDEDGYTYSLITEDASVSEGQLITMAQEIISNR